MNQPTPAALLRSSTSYAGIGSRSTPGSVCVVMSLLAGLLAEAGLTLRSGGSDGADSAFEYGCDLRRGKKEIYLPWKAFNANPSRLYPPSRAAFTLARSIHPAWNACSSGAKLLHARNCHQVLGGTLLEPVGFVLYWAPECDGVVHGGTATAVGLARSLGIPCFNLRGETREEWEALVTF